MEVISARLKHDQDDKRQPDGGVAKRTGRNSPNSAIWRFPDRSDGGGEPVMTVDLYAGPVGRTSAWVGAVGEIFCRQREGLYILMPERPDGHNNTIDLMGVFQTLTSQSKIGNFYV